MTNNASDWLIEYKLARRGCRIKMGAEYYVDRLSGLEDKEIIEKFKKTLKRNGRITTDVRKAIAEFDNWLSLLKVRGNPGEVIPKELSNFLSYNYSYFNDIPNLAHICLQQLLLLRKFFQNNFLDLPNEARSEKTIAFFLQMNLKNFETLNWLIHLVFYFEKNNRNDKVNLTVLEKKLLFKFSQIIKDESNYNKGIFHNPKHFITREKFEVIKHPTSIIDYLKRHTKKGILKDRTSKKGLVKNNQSMWPWELDDSYTPDKRPIDVFKFLSDNIGDLLSIFKILSTPKSCFRYSKNTKRILTQIRKKKTNIIRLSTSLLSIESF